MVEFLDEKETQEEKKKLTGEDLQAAGIDQIEELKVLKDTEISQQANEIIANIPVEFKVDGRTLKVDCKTIAQIVKVDGLILQLQKISYLEVEADELSEEFFDALAEKANKLYDLMADILFHILNQDPESPEVLREWIIEHIDIMEGGVGEQIIDAYNQRCSPAPFLRKLLSARKF